MTGPALNSKGSALERLPWNAITIVIVVLVLGFAALRWNAASHEKALDATWSAFGQFEASLDSAAPIGFNQAGEVPESLRPWARLLIANRPLLQQGNISESRARMETIVREFPTDAQSTALIPDALALAPVISSLAQLESWESSHKNLVENPLPPAGSKVRIVTDAGTVEIGLFPGLAPAHVENFLKLAKSGFYDRTAFHRVVNSGIHIVQGGDPNTKEGKPETWGLGGPGDGIPVERNSLAHVKGAVAMARPGASQGKPMSSGSQFYIVTGPSHSLDRQYTVFGQVLSGMETIQKISEGEIESGSMDRPKTPVRVTKCEVVSD